MKSDLLKLKRIYNHDVCTDSDNGSTGDSITFCVYLYGGNVYLLSGSGKRRGKKG